MLCITCCFPQSNCSPYFNVLIIFIERFTNDNLQTGRLWDINHIILLLYYYKSVIVSMVTQLFEDTTKRYESVTQRITQRIGHPKNRSPKESVTQRIGHPKNRFTSPKESVTQRIGHPKNWSPKESVTQRIDPPKESNLSPKVTQRIGHPKNRICHLKNRSPSKDHPKDTSQQVLLLFCCQHEAAWILITILYSILHWTFDYYVCWIHTQGMVARGMVTRGVASWPWVWWSVTKQTSQYIIIIYICTKINRTVWHSLMTYFGVDVLVIAHTSGFIWISGEGRETHICLLGCILCTLYVCLITN